MRVREVRNILLFALLVACSIIGLWLVSAAIGVAHAGEPEQGVIKTAWCGDSLYAVTVLVVSDGAWRELHGVSSKSPLGPKFAQKDLVFAKGEKMLLEAGIKATPTRVTIELGGACR